MNPAVAGHATPAESPDFPIVAIGASAGGLGAFTELLEALPTDTGMAFVLVQHLMPSHESMLSTILARATRMAVVEVENNMPVQPNRVYVIPPGKSMVLGHGLLQLAPRTEVKGVARPIDHFMRSLAEEHGHKAVGVVLSGTGNDGTLGVQEIKSAGGLTFAQDATADQSGMPSSAIDAGAVDFVLPADEIARELGRLAKHPFATPEAPEATPAGAVSFARVIDALGAGTDVDFASYKKNTLYRRIARRMMVRKIDDMGEYARLLEGHPAEVDALYQDVLINVTSFFRNPDAYEALKTSVFPKLVAASDKHREIRVWALGCSTGEEAYSLAMTFTEYLEASGKRVGLQPPPGVRALDAQSEADRMLLARYAPPAVVVDPALDIIQFRGDASAYLSPAPGKASLNLLKMLRPGLAVPVRGALHRAREETKAVRLEGLRVKVGDGWREVEVVVLPLGTGTTGGFAVIFEEPIQSRESRARQLSAEAEARIDRAEVGRDAGAGEIEFARLSQEIAATREYLQAVIEEQEAANEELQSANEEAQSANEELQSLNEELETSKEEIQSSNEELVTLNEELNNRNSEIGRVNNDLVNLMASVQMSIVMVGPDLRIRRFTPMAEKNMNLIAADVGRPIADIRTNLSITDLDTLIAEVMDTVSVREREVRDRAGRWYSLRVRPYRTLENKIDGAVLMLVDIDDLKVSQHALLESERRFELLANSAPVMIWVADLEGYRFVNRAFENFVGANEADIRVGALARYVHPEDRPAYLAAFQHAFDSRQPFEARLRMRRLDGTYRWIKSIGVPSLLPDGKLLGLIGCKFDITDIKDAEALLQELDRGRNEFMAMLAHELRNPLAGIRNASHLLGESDDAAVAEKARAIIERQSGHMARMVNELLDVARVTYNKVELLRAPVDLVPVVQKAIEATEHERSAHQQALTAPPPGFAAWVDGDAMRLEQVFVNLLGNASKYTRHGGRIWVSVEQQPGESGRGDAGWVAVRVRDNGIGIDPALIDRVFELFAESDRSTERARSGIGVGLSVAKKIVEMHGGSIEAFSAGNALGSEFTVRLPLLSPEEIPGAPDPGRSREAVREKPRRVLVVDDNVDSADSMRMLLAAHGHEVSVVHTGAAVVPATVEFRPDTILLDLGLPDMDGHRVAGNLRQHPIGRAAHIIAVTGFGQAEDFRRSDQAGIDHHLVKPVEPAALFACIGRGREK